MLGYIFERLIKPVSDDSAAVAPEAGADPAEEVEGPESADRHESLEERLEAEANASYGEELFHGRRMAGLSTLKFEGDGSVRGLRNATVSLGYVVPLEEIASSDEMAQQEPVRMEKVDMESETRGLACDALTATLECDEADPLEPILSWASSGPRNGGAEARRQAAAEPALSEAVGPASPLDPDPTAGDLPDAVISIAEAASPTPLFFTTVAASNLVVGPASAPELAEIELSRADDDPESFEFYKPQELSHTATADVDPPQDEAMVELLMAEVMREIHDEHEAFDLVDGPGHGAPQDAHAQGHIADLLDIV